MPIFLSLLVFLALYLRPSLGWKYDEGVLVLTDNNYVKVKAEFPEMLIEFYAPWLVPAKFNIYNFKQTGEFLKLFIDV